MIIMIIIIIIIIITIIIIFILCNNILQHFENFDNKNISPVIFCIAKFEQKYIEEFVNYHIKLGFDKIYIYDNEDIPTYNTLLDKYKDNIVVIPFSGEKQQYPSLEHFIQNYINDPTITHVINIDVDEFIVLKKHKNIKDFIKEYIKDDCAGIGINWRFFGSSNKNEIEDIPCTLRFTKCEKEGNKHIKTLFNKNYFIKYNTMHDIDINDGYHIKNTKNDIIKGPFNNNIDLSIIQLNHYKSKTLPEFLQIRKRGTADTHEIKTDEHVKQDFLAYDKNDVEDLTAYNFYLNA